MKADSSDYFLRGHSLGSSPVISPFCTVKGMTRLKGRSTGSIPSRVLSVSSVACSRAGGEGL